MKLVRSATLMVAVVLLSMLATGVVRAQQVDVTLTNTLQQEVSIQIATADGSGMRPGGTLAPGASLTVKAAPGEFIMMLAGNEPFQSHAVTPDPSQTVAVARAGAGPAPSPSPPAAAPADPAPPAAPPTVADTPATQPGTADLPAPTPPAGGAEPPPTETAVPSPTPDATDTAAAPAAPSGPVMGAPDASGLRWQFYPADDARSGPSGHLALGIPETDAVQVAASCRPKEQTIALDLGADTTGRAAGARVEVVLKGAGYQARRNGVVIVPKSGEGLSGVRLRLDGTDDLWAALMSQSAMTYGFGKITVPVSLAGTRAVVGAFLEHCRSLWRSAIEAQCRDLNRYRSVDGGPKINIVVVNRSGEFRHVEWIDRKGELVPMGSMDAGGSLPLSTWEGHNFLLADGPGNCIEIVRPTRASKRIEARIKSPGFGDE